MNEARLEIQVGHRATRAILDVRVSLSDPIIAAVGATGSGKEVLLDLIAGFSRPDRGTIRLDGRDLVDTEHRRWLPPRCRGVGMVPAGGALFPHFTVEENLAYGARRLRPHLLERFQAAIHTFSLKAVLGLKPAALDARETLFVAAARAVIPGPRLLLLEEPLENLEPDHARDDLEDLLERIREFECMVLFTCRTVDGLSLKPRVIRLVPGEAAE
jgi:ABC-type molybdate transport system ATPase subunit